LLPSKTYTFYWPLEGNADTGHTLPAPLPHQFALLSDLRCNVYTYVCVCALKHCKFLNQIHVDGWISGGFAVKGVFLFPVVNDEGSP